MMILCSSSSTLANQIFLKKIFLKSLFLSCILFNAIQRCDIMFCRLRTSALINVKLSFLSSILTYIANHIKRLQPHQSWHIECIAKKSHFSCCASNSSLKHHECVSFHNYTGTRDWDPRVVIDTRGSKKSVFSDHT